jgi:hypothetical protein
MGIGGCSTPLVTALWRFALMSYWNVSVDYVHTDPDIGGDILPAAE